MTKLNTSIISFMLLISASITAWAAIPPPPANQNLGIPDTQFNLLSKEVCWRCHKPYALQAGLTPPEGVPVQTTYLPNRHHQHVGTPIAGGPEQPPFPDHDNNGIIDVNYACLNCHEIVTNETGYWQISEDFRDCLFCHIVDGDEQRTVHHDTPKAKEALCGDCHGSLIRSLDAGQPPAPYSPTMITPWKSGKPNADTSITSSAGTHPGNCNFCHNTADGTDTGTPTDTTFGLITVFTNYQNHHGTGVPTITDSSKGSPCDWCHLTTFPADYTPYPDEPVEAWAIRGCQRCHDIASLHNIEADVAGDGIIPGAEDPYNGHIGNQDNCWGCHGNNRELIVTAAGLPITSATTPQLDGISTVTWKEGTTFNLDLTGNSFFNQGDEYNPNTGETQQATFTPTIQLTDKEGNSTVLDPFTAEPSFLSVTIPGTLGENIYQVQVKKANQLSNPITITITPRISISSAVCYLDYRVVLLRGDNLSDYLPGTNTGTSVSGDGNDADMVYRWKAGMIAARFNQGCPSTVTVTNVFDTITVTPVLR